MKNVLWPILSQAVRHPTRVSVIDDQRSWRYLDLVGGALYLAEKLESLTGKPHIGVMLPTSGASPLALLAIWMMGRVAVPVNYLLSEQERDYIIDDSEIDTLITVQPMLDYIGSTPKVKNLVLLEKMDTEGLPPLRWPHIARGEDPAVVLYTSGTSGKPKGVVLTHQNLRSNIEASIKHAELTASDGFLGVLPQFHSFGLTALTLIPLFAGAKVIYTARFQPAKILQLLRKHRPDIFMAIPSMYTALLSLKDAEPEDFASLRYAISGGEPLPLEVAERVRERFHIQIMEGYGLTETSPVISWSLPSAWRPRSVGRLLPGIEVRVIDEHNQPVPPGVEGEVLVRGPNVMRGYFKLPDLTAEVMDQEGFFRTGDWGRIDEEGFLYITGRKKEMLIIGGENVFPREIEEVLNAHPSVKDSAVVGRPDPTRGEVPLAFVELHEDTTFDEQNLRTWCRQRLAPFKCPREIRNIDAMPRNPTGKILRRNLPSGG